MRQGQSFVLWQHGADEANTTRVIACVHSDPATYSELKLRGEARRNVRRHKANAGCRKHTSVKGVLVCTTN